MRILKFNELVALNESKQAGYLYHITKIPSAIKILNSNELIGSQFGGADSEKYGISTTRNKQFLYDARNTLNFVQFVLDGSKISNNYKITPHDYWQREYNKPIFSEPQIVDEDEEIILTPKGKISNILNYVIEVNIFNNDLNKDNDNIKQLVDNLNKLNIKINIL